MHDKEFIHNFHSRIQRHANNQSALKVIKQQRVYPSDMSLPAFALLTLLKATHLKPDIFSNKIGIQFLASPSNKPGHEAAVNACFYFNEQNEENLSEINPQKKEQNKTYTDTPNYLK